MSMAIYVFVTSLTLCVYIMAANGSLQSPRSDILRQAYKASYQFNERDKRGLPPGVFKSGTESLVHGLQAVRRLVHGATEKRDTIRSFRTFEKFGDYGQALRDFYSVFPTDVRNFRTSSEVFGKIGMVGDRKLVLTNRNYDEPTLEVIKVKQLLHGGKSEDLPNQLLTDKIVYTKDNQ